MFKRILSIVVLVAVALFFTGCQTMHGLGGDMKWAGEQIEAGGANCSPVPPDQPKNK